MQFGVQLLTHCSSLLRALRVDQFIVLLSVLISLFAVVNLRIDLNHTGEELKPGSKVSFNAGQGYVIHLSQVYIVHFLSLPFWVIILSRFI